MSIKINTLNNGDTLAFYVNGSAIQIKPNGDYICRSPEMIRCSSRPSHDKLVSYMGIQGDNITMQGYYK